MIPSFVPSLRCFPFTANISFLISWEQKLDSCKTSDDPQILFETGIPTLSLNANRIKGLAAHLLSSERERQDQRSHKADGENYWLQDVQETFSNRRSFQLVTKLKNVCCCETLGKDVGILTVRISAQSETSQNGCQRLDITLQLPALPGGGDCVSVLASEQH